MTLSSVNQNVPMLQQKNSLTGFGRLPPELAITIFRLVQTNSTPKGYEREGDDLLSHIFHPSSVAHIRRDRTWLSLMCMCTRLRAIALGAPQLWQAEGINIPGNPHWRSLCLERAQGLAPVLHCMRSLDWHRGNVRNELDAADVSEHVSTLATYLPLTRQAYLTINFGREGFDVNDVELYKLLITHTSHLEHLSLRWDLWQLHNLFMQGCSTTLRTLSVKFFRIHETLWPQLPSLRHLQISTGLWNADLEATPVMEWLGALPTLEILSLECGIQLELRNPQGTLGAPVQLPHLHILHVKSTIYGLLELFRVLPEPSMGLDIQMIDAYDELEMFEDAVSYQHLIRHTSQFWSRHGPCKPESTTTSLPLYSSFLCTRQELESQVDFVLSSVFPSGRGIDTSKPFCRLKCPHYCELVDAGTYGTGIILHVVGNNVGPMPRDGTPGYPDIDITYTLKRMSIHMVIVEQADDIMYIKNLQLWLKKRHVEGKPIAMLMLRDSGSVQARTMLGDLAVLAGEEELVKEVFMMGKRGDVAPLSSQSSAP